MTETELRQAFEAQRPVLGAWGRFVVKTLLDRVTVRLPDRPIQYFLKIWPKPRVKETKSFLAKALRFNDKRYENPLSEITDQVGARFVVLLLPDIRIVEDEIKACREWECELARDFMEERRQNPLLFEYQSLHYVVRSTKQSSLEGLIVPAGTPCELQVRTLLQHAYSELTHDTIYKPKSALDSHDPDLNRQIARSMALIETTDHIFQQVAAAIERATADLREALERAAAVYGSRIGEPKAIDARLSEFILAPFRKSVPLITQKNLESVLDEHPSLIDFVRCNRETSVLYESPLVLIIFWLIEEDEDELWRNWPTDPAMIRDIYTQLGLSTERY